jgi:membrane-associated protease RseP (regulator of RpoE activity)
MKKPSFRSLGATLLAAALLAPWATTVPAAAQQSVVIRAPASRASGWLGLGVEEVIGRNRDGPFSGITVTQVVEGGPSHEAGLRAGDRIVAVRGAPATPALFNRIASQLEPGDRMELSVERDGGWTKDVVVVAGERPASARVYLSPAMAARIESRIEHLDSILRVTVTSGEGQVSGVVTLGEVRERSAPRGDTLSVFRFFERTDSGTTRWQTTVAPRLFEGAPPRVRVRTDTTDRLVVTGRAPVAVAESWEARPLLPYIEGQDRVGGARFTVLNADLASYFDVEGGLLVTEVIDGAPMAEAGVRPGDVVLAVDGRPVRRVDDVRSAIWRPGSGDVVLSLVRKGEPVEVRLSLRYP